MINCEGLRAITDPCIIQNGLPEGFWIAVILQVLLAIFFGLIGYLVALKRVYRKGQLNEKESK
jgi:hypothetical protein